MATIKRSVYADMFGPTAGDRVVHGFNGRVAGPLGT